MSYIFFFISNLYRLYGSYEALKGGTTAEALEDLTGGLTEFVDLRESAPPNLRQMMLRGFEMGSLFGVSIEVYSISFENSLRNETCYIG